MEEAKIDLTAIDPMAVLLANGFTEKEALLAIRAKESREFEDAIVGIPDSEAVKAFRTYISKFPFGLRITFEMPRPGEQVNVSIHRPTEKTTPSTKGKVVQYIGGVEGAEELEGQTFRSLAELCRKLDEVSAQNFALRGQSARVVLRRRGLAEGKNFRLVDATEAEDT